MGFFVEYAESPAHWPIGQHSLFCHVFGFFFSQC
jgi:hypothetical protein